MGVGVGVGMGVGMGERRGLRAGVVPPHSDGLIVFDTSEVADHWSRSCKQGDPSVGDTCLDTKNGSIAAIHMLQSMMHQ